MSKKDSNLAPASEGLEEMEGARRATGISSSLRAIDRPQETGVLPDPEVSEKPVRRRFSAEYKRRILKEVEALKDSGQIGALLRREGLYFSNLIAWRRQAEQGTLEALSPKKRGPKEKKPDPSLRRIAELEKETQKLRHKLRQAEFIMEAQKKIAEILQKPLQQEDEKNS